MNSYELELAKHKPPTPAPAPVKYHGNTRHPDDGGIINAMRTAMQPSYGLKSKIRSIRAWDAKDPRIKKVHNRMSRDVARGGLMLDWAGVPHPRVVKLWDAFKTRLKLNLIDKLKSDARQFCVQGNLALQWAYDPITKNIGGCLSMPVDTLVPNTTPNGAIADPMAAYFQVDYLSGKTTATFALWQLTLVRLDPDNFDDAGSLGRPYLDAVETALQQLEMTEEDLVIRRRLRAAQKNLFALKGATDTQIESFDNQLTEKRGDVAADFVTNTEAAVHEVGGDANMGDIGDVAHLLNTVFSAAPGSKALYGYTDDTSRDVLEDLKKDYFEEIDELQDTLATAYQQGFELELKLAGIHPAAHEFTVKFTERRTESRNQKADLALKLQAVGVSRHTAFKVAGVDPAAETKLLEHEKKQGIQHNQQSNQDADPNGEHDSNTGDKPKVSITPNNAPKGESATSIKNK